MQNRLKIIIQKNNAPSYAFKNQYKVFIDWNVSRLFWYANSSNLNAIEPCWFWMKWDITRHETSHTRKNVEKKWTKAWFNLFQKRIQQWIERIPKHIQKMINLNENNEYHESRTDGFVKSYDSDDHHRFYLTACKILDEQNALDEQKIFEEQNEQKNDDWKNEIW